MRKTIVALLLMSICSAQASFAQNDTKAKKILETVSKKINGLKTLKANFALHLFGANGKAGAVKKGTFSMKGQKYHVQLEGVEIICDTKKVWTYNKDANEVTVSTYNPNEQTISPAKLFTNFYDKEYTYTYIGEREVNGKNCDVIEMTPVKIKQFTKVELAIDKTTNVIVGGNMWEKSGTKYQYDVSGFTPNANVPDAYFTFNAKDHPGVSEVSLE